MLKGLVIRQGLLVADLILAVLILAVAYLVAGRIFDDSAGAVVMMDRASGADAGRSISLRELGDRNEYEPIVQANLYGPAGATRVEEPEPEPVVEPPTEVIAANLPLRLFGTMAAHPTDPMGTAIIENSNARTLDTYFIDQEVMSNIVLREIRRGEIILSNEAENTRLVLAMQEDTASQQPMTTASARGGRGGRPPQMPGQQPGQQRPDPRSARRPDQADRPGAPGGRDGSGASDDRPGQPPQNARNQVVLDRNALIEEMSQSNYAELYSQVSPELVSDDSGQVVGITSPNIDDIPMARQFGFQQGDVIQSINGVQIDSEARIVEVLNRFQNAPTHWVSILRNGQPETLVFRLE